MVERDEIIKGYEYAKDQYVLFTDEELKAVDQEVTRAIDVAEFVPLSDVDAVFLDKPYYLAPDKGGERSYKLFSMAMKKKGLGGLAKYCARGKQYLVLVRPLEDGLVMQQLRYANEVRPFRRERMSPGLRPRTRASFRAVTRGSFKEAGRA